MEEYPFELVEDLQEDALDDQIEQQMEKQQEVYEDTSPQYKERDDLFSLFWKVIKTADSSKVGNLDKTELGMLNISVRDCQKIALLANKLHHPGFANFFRLQAEIVLSTSASKKGWLPELFVSQRKFATKQRLHNLGLSATGEGETPKKKKRRLFG